MRQDAFLSHSASSENRIHDQASPIKDHNHQVTEEFGHLSPSALLSSPLSQISLIPSSPSLLALLPLRPLFPLPRQFQSASLDVDVSPRRSPSQQHILLRLMRTTYTNTLALERLTSKHWNAKGFPLRAEGALLCRDMHPPPIRRADRRNAPKAAQRIISW